ncbi:hypothetical protein BofuT4_P120630.1 [Botrytis cinerea T4]|uniref:Uncharacterized protein n=1 Tax=Botryotinia fuckeliana (strain T4) TaxID=999810 RepID=G2XY20_BOTF4|nr:hypothetical protein BofuT4_P120630.1 [Botrytis cinerea T4]
MVLWASITLFALFALFALVIFMGWMADEGQTRGIIILFTLDTDRV